MNSETRFTLNIFLVDDHGTRAHTPVESMTVSAVNLDVLRHVRRTMTRKYTRFVVLHNGVQVAYNHPADKTGAYVPHGTIL